MRVLLVQPPFVQLNSPYPATAYLASFLRREGHEARVVDLSIELFRRIFSRDGLARVFAEAERRLLLGEVEALPGEEPPVLVLPEAREAAGREQLDAGLTEILQGMQRIAMEYSPLCAIPYVSRVDAGTVEMVRARGVQIA